MYAAFFLAPKLKAIGDALKFEPEAETEAEIPEYRMSEANIGVVTLSHKVVRLPMIMFMHTVGLVNSASQSAMEKNPYFCTSTKFHALFGRNTSTKSSFCNADLNFWSWAMKPGAL